MASTLLLPPLTDDSIKTFDQTIWLNLVATLFSKCSYSPELQQKYMLFFTSHVLPQLIQFPSCKSNHTHNNSPFSPSRNVQDGESAVRYSFEPMSVTGGTDSDPFNQDVSFAFIEKLKKLDLLKGFNTELWEHFTKELYVWDEAEKQKVLGIESIQGMRSSLMAFDFKTKEFEIIGRVYFNLFRKSHIQEKSPAAILFEAVRKLEGREDQKAALDKLEKFFDGGRDGGFEGLHNMSKKTPENIAKVRGLNIVMIGIDLNEPSKARMKLYARSYDLDFATFKDIYTLGGQIQIDDEEFTIFKQFYAALFDLPENWDGVTEHIERLNLRNAGISWSFELQPGKQVPLVKFYISLWNFVSNDAEAAKRITRFFKEQSWEMADGYLAEVEALFGAEEVHKESGRHSYVSFAYTKGKGVYLTLYYAPKLEAEYLKVVV
ncbi:hypothetical protein V495_01747 [Pseudogymnoascus sp. VKM F-4514 (FW-929)]|nr:hypothetical protein V490_05360 [Pseudogymnoascus sp. VKM F-3557]KFY47898.1 hypothetical protein V495_01747 [Pseudogymnoascus sp. VKM F-4514 (FW-929)]KFY62710.1 hypothetical protein V497_02255 [Pseudogymnoascus sp. VKM F-4516 (FW-969)]